MSDSISRGILKTLATRKGASAFDFFKDVPEIQRTLVLDDPDPFKSSALYPSLVQLIQWGLVEAYMGYTLLDLDSLKKLWDQDYHSLRFFLSPAAAEMEQTLELNLTGYYQPIFGSPITKEWPQVFVLMPFVDHLIPVYQDHIRLVAEKVEVTIGRADDFFSADSIIQDIWSAIYHASVIIADCTGRNPNVFYETGIAHTLGRPTILICQSLKDIPFDLRHLRTIVYDLTPRGMTKFDLDLRRMLRNEFGLPPEYKEPSYW